MTFTIFFATSTGKTEEIANRLTELLPGSEAKDVDNLDSSDELVRANALICCIPTWNTGADEARSGTAWDDLAQEIPNLDFTGKSVAILGLGDSSGYSDFFCDAMEELYTAFLQSGAKLIGKVPVTGYTFESSKSVIDGKFCGLPIDEDNESEFSDERLAKWVKQINSEA
ncbi:flavodoxin FldA [Synechococcus sp. M16CYN]|uniref:flavodoxin FldA n=1 Tax=Synechococcus sp. M16CYN TaxID=3103139 RepID=UPI003248292F